MFLYCKRKGEDKGRWGIPWGPVRAGDTVCRNTMVKHDDVTNITKMESHPRGSVPAILFFILVFSFLVIFIFESRRD